MSQPIQLQNDKLVDAHGLLDRLFDAETRPSLRWVRTQTKRKTIPFFKIGRLIRFDATAVRQALERTNLISPKSASVGRAN